MKFPKILLSMISLLALVASVLALSACTTYDERYGDNAYQDGYYRFDDGHVEYMRPGYEQGYMAEEEAYPEQPEVRTGYHRRHHYKAPCDTSKKHVRHVRHVRKDTRDENLPPVKDSKDKSKKD